MGTAETLTETQICDPFASLRRHLALEGSDTTKQDKRFPITPPNEYAYIRPS